MSMNDRMKQPEDNFEMPTDDIGKANLAHKLITQEIMKQGAPSVIATVMACEIVQDVLNETRSMRETAQRHFGMMSVIHNN